MRRMFWFEFAPRKHYKGFHQIRVYTDAKAEIQMITKVWYRWKIKGTHYNDTKRWIETLIWKKVQNY